MPGRRARARPPGCRPRTARRLSSRPGPDAEALARAALKKTASDSDAAANPTTAAPGANPPFNVDGNFLIGPVYSNAPELTVNSNVPQGRIEQFSLDSTNSKFYNPGIARDVFEHGGSEQPQEL